MVDLWQFLLGLGKGLLFGVVLFLLGIFAIPHSWTIWIVSVVKPQLLKELFKRNDKYFNIILGILLDGKFTDSLKEYPDAKAKIDKLKNLRADLENIEKNMFTIDLLTELSETLRFVAVSYSISERMNVVEEIIDYFTKYSHKLEETTYRPNFAREVLVKFEQLVDHIKGSKEFEADEAGRAKMRDRRRLAMVEFTGYMKQEKDKLYSTREIVIDSIKFNALELMNRAK